jgi:hypothetical protein
MTDKAHRHDAEKKAPTAGPSEDDRGPDPQRDQEAALKAAHIALAQDFHGRVLKTDIDKEGTRITFSGGSSQGVTVGMTGTLMGKGGPYAHFEVDDVKDRYSTAHVKATFDEVRAHNEVLINPSSKPAIADHKDHAARILAYSIEGGLTRITFSAGEMHGTKYGEQGVVVSESGVELADFTVDEVDPRFSRASVKLIPDQLHNAKVILGKSKK